MRGGRPDLFTSGVVAIAVAGLVVRLWLGLQFTWLTDDWTYVVRSNTLPLPRFLLESYNGHVGPGQFLLVWLVARVAPLSFVVAASVSAVMGAAALLLWGAALRRIFGPRLVLLVALAVMAFSPMGLWAGQWWASAVQAGPLQLSTAGMVLFAARWTTTRARADLVGLLATFVVGLLFWEKSLLAVIPTLGVVWMMTPGTTRQRLRAGMPVLVALFVTSGAYLVAYLVVRGLYPGTWYAISEVDNQIGWALVADMGRGALVAVRDVLAPGLLGGPWELVPFGLSVTLPGSSVVAVVAACLLAAFLVVRGACRRHGLVPVLVIVLYVGIALALASWSTTSAVIGVEAMRNPRLMSDPLVVTLLALLLLLLPTTPEVRAGQERDWSWGVASPPRPLVAVATAVVVVAVSVGLSAGVRGLWAETRDRPAMGWAAAFRSDVASQRPVLLADGRPPIEVYPFGFWPDEAWLSKMLGGVPGARFSGSGSQLSVVGPDGHVVPAHVERQAGTEQGPVADCGYAIGPGQSIDLPLDGELYSWNWGMEASFVAGDEASLVLAVDGTPITMDVSPGVSTVVAPVNSAVTEVTLTSADTSATVCLVGLAFGPVTPSA
jgi:hypothetical protein